MVCCDQVWTYNEGEIHQVGIGHSAQITRVAISPDERFIISVSRDGAIIRWKFPTDIIYGSSNGVAAAEPTYNYISTDTYRSQEPAYGGYEGQDQADVMRLDTDQYDVQTGGRKTQTPTGRDSRIPGVTGRTAITNRGSGHGHAAVM